MEGVDCMFDCGSISSKRFALMSTTNKMSTSGLGSGDESSTFQKHSVMHSNSTSCRKHTQHVKGQPYLPSAGHQLYENHSLYKTANIQMMLHPLIPSSRQWTQDVSTANGDVPLLKSPGTLNHGSSVNNSSSSKSHTVTFTPDSYIGTSPELPPVLHLNKHPAAITMPDGIYCVINPYPEQLGVTISKSEPSSTGNTSAGMLPNGEMEKPVNSPHEVIMTLDVTK